MGRITRFRDVDNGHLLVLANVHILYGDGRRDRVREIRELASLWEWMAAIYPDTDLTIAGDFNLAPDDSAWAPLKAQGASPLITRGATTLSALDGQYSILYDNFWFDAERTEVSGAGVFDYPAALGLDHEEARRVVSDHAPVFMAINGARLPASLPGELAGDAEKRSIRSVPANSCIDLNRANLDALDELPQVGPARAQAIMQGRPWRTARDLTAVDGLGASRVSAIMNSGLLCPLP